MKQNEYGRMFHVMIPVHAGAGKKLRTVVGIKKVLYQEYSPEKE